MSRRFRGDSVPGSVVTVLAPRGGSGKTVLACNLAVVLGLAGASVCLVDLDLAEGDVAGFLGLEGPASVMSAASPDGHLVGELLETVLQPYGYGVDCVLAPQLPGDSEKISADFVEEMLTLLRSRYDYVVVDTPKRMSARVQAALDVASHHVLVGTPAAPALHSLRRMIDVLDLLCIPQAERSVLLNHADTPRTLSDAVVTGIVRSPLAGRLPDSPEVMVSINQRLPLAVSTPANPYVRAVRAFAAMRLLPSGDQCHGRLAPPPGIAS
jgi:pilus assembly protein CpaE